MLCEKSKRARTRIETQPLCPRHRQNFMSKAVLALCIVFTSARIIGQTAAPSFDAASIKPSKASSDSSTWNSRTGYLVMRNQTLSACIRIAYGLKADQITGGPKWLDSDRFDIEA